MKLCLKASCHGAHLLIEKGRLCTQLMIFKPLSPIKSTAQKIMVIANNFPSYAPSFRTHSGVIILDFVPETENGKLGNSK